MKKIKVLTIMLSALFMLSFTAAGINTSAGMNSGVTYRLVPDQVTDYSIAIVYSTGGLGDQSFNDAAKRGIEAAKANASANANINLEVKEACKADCTDADVTKNIKLFADDTAEDFDLIIGIGFTALDGINSSAIAHTDQTFMIIDENPKQSNVRAIQFKEQEGSFLVGAMAAMVSETGQIAMLAALDAPLFSRFIAGYEHGARLVDEDVVVRVTYAPDVNNLFNDVAGGERVATEWFKDGVDVVFAAAGETGVGTYNAAEKWNDGDNDNQVYAVGVDSYSDHLKPGHILASMIKNVDFAVEDVLMEMFYRTGGIQTISENRGLEDYGANRPGVDISNMSGAPAFTAAEAAALLAVRDADYDGTLTRWEKVQALKASVLAGTITVRDDLDDGGEFDFGEEEEGIPLPTAYMIFAVFTTAVLIRRKRK
ncbi:MAG: BMP family lipoprotein [Candidatus Kariarchaeaceae archaeon]|jgi:basic membrane protein A